MSIDPTAYGDTTAAEMRTYYDANRPRTFVEMLFGKRSTAPYASDNLMIGLLNIALARYLAVPKSRFVQTMGSDASVPDRIGDNS